ncbi:MAG: hypothetical protein ABSF93_13960 [Candidatus Sulfotelmatobacter sp.]|jgi:hypothetical protein
MHGIMRTVATLLLLTITAALPAAQAMPFGAGHAAGCHNHGPANPSPAPTSYQCCVNGHHAAVPIVSFSLHLAAVQVGRSNSEDRPRLALPLNVSSTGLIFPSSSPPGPVPLRI